MIKLILERLTLVLNGTETKVTGPKPTDLTIVGELIEKWGEKKSKTDKLWYVTKSFNTNVKSHSSPGFL